MLQRRRLAWLKRTFWSGYGRWVWDSRASESPTVPHVVAVLTAHAADARHVLDVGCGTGTYARALAQAGFAVTGIDWAPGMLARAQTSVTPPLRHRLGWCRMDLDRPLAFVDQQFAQAIAISVLQAVGDPAFTLRELWRVLRPGGCVVVLHWPRPAMHGVPLAEEVRQRARTLERATVGKLALLTVKSWAERSGGTRYWTAEELQALLRAAGFGIAASEAGPPLVLVATKPAV